MAQRPPTAESPCLRCGRCCQALSLDFSKRALRELARREERCLRREPSHRHAADMHRVIADVAFVDEHFHRIARRTAADINPTFASAEFDGRFFYTCDSLGDDGMCRLHAGRPYLCEGYPWYRESPRLDALVVYPCGYERDLLPDRLVRRRAG